MITWMEKEVQLTQPEGKNVRFALHLGKMDARRTAGDIFCDEVRIIPQVKHFKAAESGDAFQFDLRTKGLTAGSEVRGHVTMATDCGEAEVPVILKITGGTADLPDGIKSIRDLADLAERDRDEAFRIFMSPSFPSLLRGCSARTAAIFQGLKTPPVSPQRLEEFLVSAGWKKPVNLSIDKKSEIFWNITTSEMKTIRLVRSAPGFLDASVRVEGDFIDLPKRRISDQDFVGSSYDLEYVILKNRLGRGRRFGKITLNYAGGVLEYAVSVSSLPQGTRGVMTAGRKNTVQITRLCLDTISGRMAKNRFANEVLSLLAENRSLNADSPLKLTLAEAGLRLMTGASSEAAGLIESISDRDKRDMTPEERGIYLMVRSRASGAEEDPTELADRMHSLYLRQQDSPVLMKLCMVTDPDLLRSPRLLVRLFEGTFAAGSRSPLLYAEAVSLLRRDSSALTRLTPLMLSALRFAAREDLLTRDIALRAAFLAGGMKGSPSVLANALAAAYEKWPADAILEAIVRLLLKGQPGASDAFRWYSLAVNRGLRIIGLYEHYMETVPRNTRDILPAQIRKYFIFNNTLNADSRAFLYANIVRNESADPETYAAYRGIAEAFAHESLLRGRTGEDYALLYTHFIKTVPDGREGRNLTDLIFTEQLFIDDPEVRNVIVVHRELAREASWPVTHGVAYIRRYTKQAQILFENGNHDRFRKGTVYSTGQLIARKPYLPGCMKKFPDAPGIVLSVTETDGDYASPRTETVPFFRRAADSADFSESFRRGMRMKLLRFYSRQPELSGFGEEEIGEEWIRTDKSSCVGILLALGKYDRAFRILKDWGTEGVPAEQLVRLASRLLDDAGENVPADLVRFSAAVCRKGKYDERILACLAQYFEGSLREMLDFRRLAKDFYVDTLPIDGRIIRRCAREGIVLPGTPDILKNYAENGGNPKTIRAYIQNAAASYLRNDEIVNAYTAHLAEDIADTDAAPSDEVKLMLLKYFSQEGNLTVHEEVLVDSLLSYFQGREIRLGFFQNLPSPLPEQFGLSDRTFIEVKADPADSIVLHYRIFHEDSGHAAETGNEENWQSVPLTHMIAGIFSKEFTLFYGEELVWNADITHDGETTRTPAAKAKAGQTDFRGRSAFQRINRMLKERREGDREGLRSDLDDYMRTRQQAAALFSIV